MNVSNLRNNTYTITLKLFLSVPLEMYRIIRFRLKITPIENQKPLSRCGISPQENYLFYLVQNLEVDYWGQNRFLAIVWHFTKTSHAHTTHGYKNVSTAMRRSVFWYTRIVIDLINGNTIYGFDFRYWVILEYLPRQYSAHFFYSYT